MAAILAVAMIVAMWIVPVSAVDADVVLDLDYGNKAWKGESLIPVEGLPLVNDYGGDFTFEMYVQINDFSTPSVIAGSFAGSTAYAFWVNGGTFYFSAGDTNGNNHVTLGSDVTADWTGKWLHVLGVKNGYTNILYICPEGSNEYVTSSTQRTTDRIYTNATTFRINDSELGFTGAGDFSLGTVRMYNADVSENRLAMKAECEARLKAATQPEKDSAPLIFRSKPDKLAYEIGEELDITGLAVATKADGVLTDVDIADCTLEGFDSSAAGLSVVNLTYETEDTIYTNKFTVRINAPVATTVSAIALATKPSKLVYNAGEELDITGLSVTVKYSDGTTTVVSEGLDVTGYDADLADVQRLTVTYEGKTTGFSVKVNPTPEVRQIVLASKPDKLSYENGEDLDLTGLTVKAKYTDGTTAIIEADELTVTGYDATVAGIQRLTVAYGAFAQTTGFSVRVAEEPAFDTNLIFNVDFRTGSYIEQIGGIEPSLKETTFLGYAEGPNGEAVADLSSPTMLEYNIPFEIYAAMQDTYTMEAYVNISDGNGENLGFIAGDTGWLADNGVGFWVRNLAGYGSGTELSAQEGKGTVIAGGNRSEWNHLVYVHDGDTALYYVNGVLVGTATVTTTLHDTTVGFHIGSYAGDGNFAALGQYAFVKVYSAAATADQVADLYAAR